MGKNITHYKSLNLDVTLMISLKLIKIEVNADLFSKDVIATLYLPMTIDKPPYNIEFDKAFRYRLQHDKKITCNHYTTCYKMG